MGTLVEPVAEAVVEEVQVSTTQGSPVVDQTLIAQLVGNARAQGVAIDGEGGLLARLTRLVVESALEGEMTVDLGGRGTRAWRG